MAGTAIMWPIQYPMMSAVTPATYSNSLTYQEILYIIKGKVDELIEFTAELTSTLEAMTAANEKNKELLLAEMDKRDANTKAELAKMETRLRLLIADVSVGGSAYDPTDGTTHKSVSEVFDRIYGYVRTEARFTADLDDDGLTAAEIDALGMTARRFDLDPENNTSHATE